MTRLANLRKLTSSREASSSFTPVFNEAHSNGKDRMNVALDLSGAAPFDKKEIVKIDAQFAKQVSSSHFLVCDLSICR